MAGVWGGGRGWWVCVQNSSYKLGAQGRQHLTEKVTFEQSKEMRERTLGYLGRAL